MKLFAALLAIGFAASVSAFESNYFGKEELDAHWAKFKEEHNRGYISETEDSRRREIFASNLEFIYRHNVAAHWGLHSYTVAVNKFADLTNDEFRHLFTSQGRTPVDKWAYNPRNVHKNASMKSLPASVDWVAKGKVTPVMNQGIFGEDWAFASTAAIESAHAIASNQLAELAVQQVSDCCNPYSAGGLTGGYSVYDSIFECLIKMAGVDIRGKYPDPDVKAKCQFNPRGVVTAVANFVDIGPGDEASLQGAVANQGPVAVTVDASQSSFQFYAQGVYNEPACSSDNLDHSMVVVGYGSESGADFWKVKNSWGANWGMQGYILMSRNKHNQCGIATGAAYPVVKMC